MATAERFGRINWFFYHVLPVRQKYTKLCMVWQPNIRNMLWAFEGGFTPKPLPRALPLDPAGGLPSPYPLCPLSRPNPGCATAIHTYDTIPYDTRCYLTCAQKPTHSSQYITWQIHFYTYSRLKGDGVCMGNNHTVKNRGRLWRFRTDLQISKGLGLAYSLNIH